MNQPFGCRSTAILQELTGLDPTEEFPLLVGKHGELVGMAVTVEEWREKAKRTRARAEHARQPSRQEYLLDLARVYEKNADTLEIKLAKKVPDA